MSSIPSAIASFLVNSVWEIPPIAVAGYAMARLLKKLGPEAEHFVWVSTLAVAVAAPSLPLLRQMSVSLFALGTSSEHTPVALLAAQGGELKTNGALTLPTALILVLMLLCLTSFFYFAVRFLWSCYRTEKLICGASAASLTTEQEEIWRACRSAFSLDAARILNSRRISGPVTLGFREPVLLVPKELSLNSPAQDFLAALAHECAHIKRLDFQKNLLYEAASLFVAFHPVIWMIKSKIAQTREMVCDKMATENLIDSKSYVQSLLRLAATIAVSSRLSTSHAIGIFDTDILEKRIMIMKMRKQSVGGGVRFGLTLSATLVLLVTGAGGVAMAVAIQPATNSQVASQARPNGHVYRVGKDVSSPTVSKSIDAVFPKSALALKDFDGICLVGLVVDESGTPRDVHVVRSLSPEFDASAIKAVQKYRFIPGKRLGSPVAVAVNIEIHFKKY
jgi:TonB family protein